MDRLVQLYGCVDRLQGSTSEAEPFIRRVLALNPTLVHAWRNLALLQINRRQSLEAVATLQQAIRTTVAQAQQR